MEKAAQKASYRYVLWTAGLAAVAALVLLYTFWGEGYLFLSRDAMSDLLRVNLPTYYQLYDAIASGGSCWNWRMGIGTSMFAHADVVCDPFTYLLFLRGREHIPEMFVWVPACKTVCAAAAACLYFRWFRLDGQVCAFCAVLYAISGIQIFGINFALGTVCVYCPLYLLGMEHLLAKKDWRLAGISLLATCLYSYYFFYISGILCAIYLVVRLAMEGTGTVRAFVRLVLTLLGIGVACIGLSAWIFLPQVELVSNSVRTSTGKDVSLSGALLLPSLQNLLNVISRTFQLNLLGDHVKEEYVGKYHDYFQFTTYITAAAVPLLAQFWAGAGKKARAWLAVVTALCAVCVAVPLFSFGMNSFSTINYRWMFILNLLLALGCALGGQTVVRRGKFYRGTLYGSILAAMILAVGSSCWLRLEAGQDYFASKKAWLSVLLVMAMLVLLDLYSHRSGRKVVHARVLTVILAVAMIAEAEMNYRPWYHDEPVASGYQRGDTLYDGTDSEIVQSLQAENTGFYRIQKDFDPVVNADGIPSDNDAMAQGYYGLKSYCSLNNAEYIRFLSGMDLACYYYMDYQPSFEAQVFCIQELDNGMYTIADKEGRLLTLDDTGTAVAFEEPQPDAAGQQWQIRRQSDEKETVTLLSAQDGKTLGYEEAGESVVLCPGSQELFSLSLLGWTSLDSNQSADGIRNGYYRMGPAEQGDLLAFGSAEDGTVTLQTALRKPSEWVGDTFNYANGVYDHYDLMSYLGVKYLITQEEKTDLPASFSLLREQSGYWIYQNSACYPLAFESNQTVSEEDFMTLYGAGKESVLLHATVVSGGETTLADSLTDPVSLAQARQKAFTLDSFSADRVEFDLQVSRDAEYLNLTMPYDEDWQITIDGEPVPGERVNLGLLGTKLTDAQKGRTIHVILQYRPKALYAGGAVSLFTIAILLGLLFIKKKHHKRERMERRQGQREEKSK